MSRLLIFCFLCLATLIPASETGYGMSGNPGAVNILTGSGDLGKFLHIPESSGVRLGGVWMGDTNALLSGGRWTSNSVLILDLYIDLQKACGWSGGRFGAEFLQFNGQPTNATAGVVQGYNSLPGSPPLDRSELYQVWLLQELFNKKLTLRIGKVVPTYHFNNVSKPVPTEDPAVYIPSVTGLIYTPIFVNTTLSGAIGGFYNSVYGAVATLAPVKEFYLNLGCFDGNVARGVQTGLKLGPEFNGYYFSIGEAGYGWSSSKPGIIAVGGWYQSGELTSGTQEEDGTGGIYAFGSKALWIKESKSTSKGNVSGFFQFGWNHSKTLDMNLFLGAGLTAFALIQSRPNDSFGCGLSWSRLNPHIYERSSELMLQAYYQAKIYGTIYFQPVVSYIPNPGNAPTKSNVWALTTRLAILF